MSSNSEDSDSSEDETYVPEKEEKSGSENEQDEGVDQADKYEDEMTKKEVDKIWDSFKSELKQDHKVEASNEKVGMPTKETDKKPTTEEKVEEKDTITVTKVYDFAGEEVKITKEVKKDSKEAQNHLSKSATASKTKQESVPILNKIKRPGGLQGVLGKLNKKPKLSTLEKSKLDWQSYTNETGIEEELKSHNKGKGGYLEKLQFLERTDYRQFEKERDVRLARSSKR